MAIEGISENKRKQIINKSVNPLPNNPSKAGYKADEIKKAMFNFVTDEKDSVVDEINRIVDETNASFNDIDNTNQETSKAIESINNTIKQINDTVSDKVDKEEGKHLSSNDFSSEEKEKLAKLTNYDDSEVRAGINEINSKIPAQASSTNQLADKDFVNSSIETATATFKGTFEDLDLLKETPADNNDYAFYDHISNSNRVFDRYKYNGTEWVYEYTLNNSSFTDAQWKAINSGATAELINKILTNADNINTILNTLNNIDTRLNDTVDKSSPQNISGLKNFTKRPTVNNTEVALKTDIAEGVGTTVTVKGEAVTEFNADSKLDATANAVSATKATQDGDGNTITDTYVEKWSQAEVLTGRTYDLDDLFYENRDGRFICHTLEDANNCSHKPEENVNGFTLESHFMMKGENPSYRTYIQNYESINGKWFRTSSQEGTGIEPVWSKWKKFVTPDDNVASATRAGYATTATKATQDSDGNKISTTYVKNSKVVNTTNKTLGNDSGWDSADYGTNVPALNILAYWDGRYAGDMTRGNLAYCNKGAFGDIVTKNLSDDINFTSYINDATTGKYCTAKSGASVTHPYHRIAHIGPFSANYTDAHIVLLISMGYNDGGYGIVDLSFRTDRIIPTSSTALAQVPRVNVRWLVKYNLSQANLTFNINYDDSTSNSYGTIYKNITCDVFYKISGTYNGIVVKELLSDYRGTPARRWTLVDSNDSSSTSYSECWATQAEASTALRGGSAKITGNSALSGSVNYSVYADYGTTQAVGDNSRKIATTAWVRSYICPAGTVMAFAGSTTPSGWLLCDGSAVSRTTYSALYSAIGTTYGTGNGSTTFNIPKLNDNRFIEGYTSGGTKKDAGIPNIQGKFAYTVRDGPSEGAFSWGSHDTNKIGSGSSYDTKQGIFNASKGDTGTTTATTTTYNTTSVYGKSATVQPKSLTMRYIIKY